MSYEYIERPPPCEGIWKCERCMMLRPFVTLPEMEGRNILDAPLFCLECDWEICAEVDFVRRYPDPPVEQKRMMDPKLREAGKERLRQYLLQFAVSRKTPEAPPVDPDALAVQLAQLTAGGRRAA